ncbi:MAG TPA: FtsX-like permease family protein [Gammaproteobacteria bacterium]|nr:FtsX-like permease family protein [Gammaproteobacteria bacterium]
MTILLAEFKQALRRLIRQWGFSLTFILTLGLAIGANGGVFAALYAYVFQPLPYPHADRLVIVQNHDKKMGWTMSPPYLDFSKVNGIESGGRAQWDTATVAISGHPRSVRGVRATPGLFPMLGVQPFMGRWLDPDAGKPGAAKEVVLSYGFWHSAFHGDPKILGHPLRIDGQDYRIIGVMPRGFYFPRRDAAFWRSLPNNELIHPRFGMPPGQAFARIAPSVSLQQGVVALKTRGAQVIAAGPKWLRDSEIVATPLREYLTHSKSDQLLLMQAGTLALLLLAVANLGNLALVRALRRQHEFALRMALGARRRTLVRVAFVEALPLGLAAGGLGLLLAKYAAATLGSFGIADRTTAFHIAFTGQVIAATLGLALAVALLAMIAPLVMVRRDRLEALLKQGTTQSGGSRNALNVRRSLSALQIALAVLLLSGAALIGLSLNMMVAQDPGFNADHLVAANLQLNGPKYNSNAKFGSDEAKQFNARLAHDWQAVRRAAAALPGIESAGIGMGVPFTGWTLMLGLQQPGHPKKHISVGALRTDGSLLRTLGVHLLSGRLFTQADIKNNADVVIMDQALARQLYGTTDVVGRPVEGKKDKTHIIGVVATIKDQFYWGGNSGKIIETPGKLNSGGTSADLVVRSSLPPVTVAKELRTMLTRTLPDQSFSKIATMRSYIDDAAQDTSALAALLIACGIVALALASIGTYGVIAQLSRNRRREFAVRVALGALPGQIEALVLRSGLVLWAIGSLIGVGLAIWMGLLFSDWLYKVSVFDPVPYIAAAGLIGVIVLLASWLPARSARRLDLSDALQGE